MFILNEEQVRAYKAIDEGHNLVILGQAGTGKTALIREIQSRLRAKGKRVAVVASTGIAATQFSNGTTLHSFCGLQDGRFANDVLLKRLSSQEYQTTVKRILSTDVFIADESSMISVHIFEQVEYIFRKLRDDRYVFGGMQVVFVGDWFQLPPVANIINNDPGLHCFKADVWKDAIKHKVILNEVMRQKDHELIRAINELERGFPSESTHQFMESLSRPLPPGDRSLTLYGTNFEVDWHNAKVISGLPGEVMVYNSTDSGLVGKLKGITAKKVLSLKLNCPVILLRNLGKSLVNGLQGTVTRLEEDGPTVRFPTCSLKLKKVTFSVVDSCNVVEAEREQFPIAPAFALTVHKAQGLTLPRLIVNCKNIFNPGQLGVAVGRAVAADGLQVLNYTRQCSKRHQEEVYNFFDAPGLQLMDDDITCCHEIVYTSAPSREDMDLEFFSDDSDYDDNDLQRISNLEFEAEAKSETKLQDKTEVPELSTKARYQDSQVQGVLESFRTENALTPQQKNMNEAISFLQRFPGKIKFFFEDQHQKLTKLLKECDTGKSLRDETAFLKKFHAYLLTHEYQRSCCELFLPTTVNKLLLLDIITYIRKDVISAQKSTEEETIDMDMTENEVDVPESGHSKVRYVAGFTVAKLRNHYMNIVRNSLHAYSIVLDVSSKLKVDMLHSLTTPHIEICDTTKYSASLAEVSRKQNVRCGLTNVSDECFEFFLLLERKRIPLYGQKYFVLYKSDLLAHIHSCVLADNILFQRFVHLFHQFTLTWISTEHSDVSSVLADLTFGCSTVTDLFQQIVNKYLNVTDSEFRRKLLAEMGRKKTLEHRKQVLLKKTSKAQNQSLSWSSLKDDKSSGKQASHLKIKGCAIQDVKQLTIFTKDQLILISAAYGLTLNKLKKKDSLIESLSQCLLQADTMVEPSLLDRVSDENRPSSTSQEDTSSHDTRMVTSEIKCSSKGKSKGKGKGKGKGQAKISTKRTKKGKKIAVEEEEEACTVCEASWSDNDEEPWISCSKCEQWYHRSCGGIKFDKDWEKFSSEEVPWFCPFC